MMCKCGHSFEEHNPTGECLEPGCDCEMFVDESDDDSPDDEEIVA
jgi:hypothetical protein